MHARVKRHSRRIVNRTGAYSVEFAVVASLFFMTLLASFEFTRLYFARHSVDQATYEAAREGIVQGATPAQVEAKARQVLAAAGIKPLKVTVSPSVINELTETVTVTIECDFGANSWIPGRFFLDSKVTATTTLDHENQAYLLREDTNNEVGDNENEPQDI